MVRAGDGGGGMWLSDLMCGSLVLSCGVVPHPFS